MRFVRGLVCLGFGLTRTPRKISAMGQTNTTDATPIVQLRSVDKTYAEGDTNRVVFTDLRADFPAGGIIILEGASGSGKSTLLNLISGIDLPERGGSDCCRRVH